MTELYTVADTMAFEIHVILVSIFKLEARKKVVCKERR